MVVGCTLSLFLNWILLCCPRAFALNLLRVTCTKDITDMRICGGSDLGNSWRQVRLFWGFHETIFGSLSTLIRARGFCFVFTRSLSHSYKRTENVYFQPRTLLVVREKSLLLGELRVWIQNQHNYKYKPNLKCSEFSFLSIAFHASAIRSCLGLSYETILVRLSNNWELAADVFNFSDKVTSQEIFLIFLIHKTSTRSTAFSDFFAT